MAAEGLETTRIITGFRPTSDLTIGNYLGATKPVLDIQDDPHNDLYVFVADLHGLTDHDARELAPYRKEVIRDNMALGVDATRATVYLQSDIELAVQAVSTRLGPNMSVAELIRTPNIKVKMRTAVDKGRSETDDALTANYALLGYPMLMAADIFVQRAPLVAVGKDQEPHIELARELARRFNRNYDTSVLVEPQIFAVDALRIVSLDGKGKMSKSVPNQAILLTDDPEEAQAKIKRATTANAGDWDDNDTIQSHFIVAENTTTDPERLDDLAKIKASHIAGHAVMRDFKKLWGAITIDFLDEFQQRHRAISDADVDRVVAEGAAKANANAMGVYEEMKEAMGF